MKNTLVYMERVSPCFVNCVVHRSYLFLFFKTIFLFSFLLVLSSLKIMAQETALSIEDVLVIIPAPTHVRSSLVERRCVSFSVDATVEKRLRAAGADDSLIQLIKNACELAFRDAESVGTTTAYANYINRNPQGRFIKEARLRKVRLEEADAFQKAVEEIRGPIYQYYAYQRYLDTYPNGTRVSEARAAMESIIR